MFRDSSAACAHSQSADICLSCSPLNTAEAREALLTSCKCLWLGSQWVQSRWEEQDHVSQRRSGLPASGIPPLAGRETQCMLPLPTFPSCSVGYYMFIEASRPRVTGDKARLISPLYNITAKYYCVSFYYHMYGKHIGEYPPGKGNPSLVWAVREDLQPASCSASCACGTVIQEGGSPTPALKVPEWAAAFRYLSLTHTTAVSGL